MKTSGTPAPPTDTPTSCPSWSPTGWGVSRIRRSAAPAGTTDDRVIRFLLANSKVIKHSERYPCANAISAAVLLTTPRGQCDRAPSEQLRDVSKRSRSRIPGSGRAAHGKPPAVARQTPVSVHPEAVTTDGCRDRRAGLLVLRYWRARRALPAGISRPAAGWSGRA